MVVARGCRRRKWGDTKVQKYELSVEKNKCILEICIANCLESASLDHTLRNCPRGQNLWSLPQMTIAREQH